MDEPDPGRLTDAEILRSVEETVLGVLLPALPEQEQWARALAVQLVGLVRYAENRGPDRRGARLAELAATLAVMTGNPIVDRAWDGDTAPGAVLDAVGAALAAAATRTDADADDVRRRLRPVVIRHLDEELQETGPLVDAFRGKLG
jgi:hypothetical protein